MSAATRRLIPGFVLCTLCGCTTMSESTYSPRYLPVHTSMNEGLGYLPQACRAENPADVQDYLPPGCANALNLVDMVVDKNDLNRGRTMGPPLVAPAAMAVERYLGVVRNDEEDDRRKKLELESNTGG